MENLNLGREEGSHQREMGRERGARQIKIPEKQLGVLSGTTTRGRQRFRESSTKRAKFWERQGAREGGGWKEFIRLGSGLGGGEAYIAGENGGSF